MGLCRDCRHWDKDGVALSNWVAEATKLYRECLNPELSAEAACQEGWGSVTSIETAPGFGCNQFKPRG